jgi:hypothetical protein
MGRIRSCHRLWTGLTPEICRIKHLSFRLKRSLLPEWRNLRAKHIRPVRQAQGKLRRTPTRTCRERCVPGADRPCQSEGGYKRHVYDSFNGVEGRSSASHTGVRTNCRSRAHPSRIMQQHRGAPGPAPAICTGRELPLVVHDSTRTRRCRTRPQPRTRSHP